MRRSPDLGCFGLAVAPGIGRGGLRGVKVGVDKSSPIYGTPPRDAINPVIDDLVALAAHRTQVVQGHLTCARTTLCSYDSSSGQDVVLPDHVDLR
jgi:hypothetical protein